MDEPRRDTSDAADGLPGGSGISRREAIKRGALIGGTIAWAVPSVQVIRMSAAGAEAGTPSAACACTQCSATAIGLSALGVAAGAASGNGCSCTLSVNLGIGLGSASSQTVCGKANEATCSASALVEGLAVQVASNVLLKASLLSSCVTCGTGSSQVAGLKLVVDLGPLGKVDVTLAVAAGCSSRVAIPTTGYSLTVNAILATVNSTVSIFANEQACSGGTLTVNALRVSVLGVANVVVAQSKSGAPGCGCTACGTSPGCTPPAARLC